MLFKKKEVKKKYELRITYKNGLYDFQIMADFKDKLLQISSGISKAIASKRAFYHNENAGIIISLKDFGYLWIREISKD